MPTYKLHYFDSRGKGEPARLLFHYGNIEYEDIRVSQEEWPALKPTMPMGQVPILEVDDKVLVQSGAIYRFLARKVGLYGKDDFECAEIDMVLDTCQELYVVFPTVYKESDPAKVPEAQKKLSEETLPRYFAFFEKCLEKGSNGFLVGGQMTVADICVVHDATWALTTMMGCSYTFDKFPRLKALIATVNTHPKFADWIAKNPVDKS